MSHIKSNAGPYTLDALNEEVVFGPDYIDLNLSDTDALLCTVVAVTSTLDLQCQTSLDGTNWTPQSLSRGVGFGATIQLVAAPLTDVCLVGHNNRTYVKFKIIAYTSGSVTLSNFISIRYLTR